MKNSIIYTVLFTAVVTTLVCHAFTIFGSCDKTISTPKMIEIVHQNSAHESDVLKKNAEVDENFHGDTICISQNIISTMHNSGAKDFTITFNFHEDDNGVISYGYRASTEYSEQLADALDDANIEFHTL